MNENEQKNRFIPKQDIAYWCPITKEMDCLVSSLMGEIKSRTGHYPPKFQMIEQCISDKAKERNISEYSPLKPKFVVGNKQ